MKKKEISELRSMDMAKLEAKVLELKTKLTKELLPSLGEERKNVKIARGLKNNISVFKTLISEKKLLGETK